MNVVSVLGVLFVSLVVTPGLVLAAGWTVTRLLKQPVERRRLIAFTLPMAAIVMWASSFGTLAFVELPWLEESDHQPIAAHVAAQPTQELAQAEELIENASNRVQQEPAPLESMIVVSESTTLNEDPVTVLDTRPRSTGSSQREQSPTLTNRSERVVDRNPTLDANAEEATVSVVRWTPRKVAVLGLIVVSAVGLGLIVRMLVGLWWLKRSLRTANEASDRIVGIMAELLPSPARRIRVLVASDVQVPFAFGCIQPTIVLPHSLAEGAKDTELRMALSHELAHVCSADLWVWSLSNMLQLCLWHHPLYWKLRAELRLCQDQLADVWSVQRGCDEVDYAEMLLGFAQKQGKASHGVALCMSEKRTNLTRRIRMLALELKTVRTACRQTLWLSISAMFALVFVLGSFKLVTAKPSEASAAETSRDESASVDASQDDEGEEAAQEDEANRPMEVPEWQGKELTYTGVIEDKRTGEPIAGATVKIRRSVYTSQEMREMETTEHMTNAQGQYTFTIPPEQTSERALYIELEAAHPNYAAIGPMGYAMSMIRKNETLGERPFFEHRELEPAEAVTGVIVDPDGKPMPGVKLLGYSKRDASDFREYGSFTRAETNEDGTFSLNLIKDGLGVFWIHPEEYAIARHVVEKQRGDVGVIKLKPGVRSGGQVLDARGRPVPDVYVSLSGSFDEGADSPILQNVADSNDRGALTDSEGRFEFRPVAPGTYRLDISEYNQEPAGPRSRDKKPVPGVFVRQNVELTEGVVPEPFHIQAVPHVLFSVQYYDGNGDKCRGHEVMLFGRMDGEFVQASARPDNDGKGVAMLPHGIEQLQVMLMTNEHGSLRYRKTPDEELKPAPIGGEVMYDRVEEDIEGFEIVRYKAPIVLIEAVDESGNQIDGFVTWAEYPWGDQRYIIEGGLNSDLSFEKQQDGRYRTSQMLPDADVTFHIEAEGYESYEEVVNLKEGTEKILRVTLKKNDDDDDLPKASSEAEASVSMTTHEGMVVDRSTNKPVVNATVTVTRSLRHPSGNGMTARDEPLEVSKHTTNEFGEFTFELSDEVADRENVIVWFVAEAEGYSTPMRDGVRATRIRDENTPDDQLVFKNLELSPARRITGRLLNPEGQPVSGSPIRVSAARVGTIDTLGYYKGTSDSDGQFEFEVAQDAVAVINIYGDEYATHSVVVPDTESDCGDIQLEEGVSLHGRVLDARGEPCANLGVHLMGRDFPQGWPYSDGMASPYFRGVRTDEEGHYKFPPLPEGEYQLSISQRLMDPVRRDESMVAVDQTYVHQSINLSRELASEPYTIQAVPHVDINVAFVNLDGTLRDEAPYRVSLFGRLRGNLYSTPVMAKTGTEMNLKAPHGLEDASIQLNYLTNDYFFAVRNPEDGELIWEHPVRLGDIVEDREKLEIIVARFGSLQLEVVDEDGDPVENASGGQLQHLGEGKYEIKRALPGYEYKIPISAPGMADDVLGFQVGDNEDKVLKITMSKKEDDR